MPFVDLDCICDGKTICHFHAWEKSLCLICGWPVWVPTEGQLELNGVSGVRGLEQVMVCNVMSVLEAVQ